MRRKAVASGGTNPVVPVEPAIGQNQDRGFFFPHLDLDFTLSINLHFVQDSAAMSQSNVCESANTYLDRVHHLSTKAVASAGAIPWCLDRSRDAT